MSLPPVCEDCGEVTECRPSATAGHGLCNGWLLDPRYICYNCHKKFRERLIGQAYDDWYIESKQLYKEKGLMIK